MEKMQVEILSKTKQRRSLGETKKREKSKKPSRTAVVMPGDVEWPDVDDEVSQEILITLESTMKCLNIPKRQCPLNEIKAVPKLQRSEYRRKWVASNSLKVGYDISAYILKRTEISIGVNCCSMNMEIDQLAGLIIEKNVDPQIITKLLVPIARSKFVPIISLSGLSTTFHKACGIKCIALGFKKICESPSSEFYSLLGLVKEHTPLDVNQVLQRAAAIRARLWTNSIQQGPLQTSHSLTSSCVEDCTSMEPDGPQTPVQFSIQDEIEKLELKGTLKKVRQECQSDVDNQTELLIPPKIRKMTPQ